MSDLDAAHRSHPGEFVAKTDRLEDKIETVRGQMRRMDGLQHLAGDIIDRESGSVSET